jgi:Zn finger protein HypA/HybF involved in hydrogenase expression
MVASTLLFITLMVVSIIASAETVGEHWHAGIGDPTIFGWITVVFYFAAVILSFKNYTLLKKSTDTPKFWLYLAIFLLFLGLNKQLDLQTWLTLVMRDNAVAHGWYANRRVVQATFILFLGIGLFVALFSLRLFLAKSWHLYKLTWLGILLLCTFILMRAASFHHFDIFINTHLLGLRINVLLEIGALILIIIGTLRHQHVQIQTEDNARSAASYIEIKVEGDPVCCPNCGHPPVSETVQGRLFKCKQCGHKYTVYLSSH